MHYFEETLAPQFRYPWFTRWLVLPLGLLFYYLPPLSGTDFHRWLNRCLMRREVSVDGGQTWRRV